jgi:nicotinamide-nucleotide amidase
MKTEIISIGTELTTGQNLDTNSQWLSRRLGEMGIAVHFHTTLSDDLADNVAAFRIARDRAQLVIITGGLGPTQDDLTREALAELAGAPLVFHEPSWQHILDLFAKRARAVPERNRVQAMFPAGSEPIPNAKGTAPGVWMKLPSPKRKQGTQASLAHAAGSDDCVFIAIPGVPSELYAMFEREVQPRLQQWAGQSGVMVERKINCFGAGESAVEEKLMDLTRRGHVPEVGITVSDATISLRILAKAENTAAAEQLIAPVERTIRERLGDLVFGVGEEELQHAVAGLLKEKKQTVAVAESITGGLIAHRLTQISGISAHFRGGMVTYDDGIKANVLGVPPKLLEDHGAVSAPVAEAMAAACRERFGVDLALSTTGIAGPNSDASGKPVGLVYVGLAWNGGVRSVEYHWWGSRHEIQSRTAKLALNHARLHLMRGNGQSGKR